MIMTNLLEIFSVVSFVYQFSDVVSYTLKLYDYVISIVHRNKFYNRLHVQGSTGIRDFN